MSNLQPALLGKLLLILVSALAPSQSIAADYVYSAGKGITFGWVMNDDVTTYSQKGSRLYAEVEAVDADTHRAIVVFNGFSLRPNIMYYAYRPYNTDYYMNSLPITDLPITYLGQRQTGNATLTHLQPFDYMMGQYTTGETTADISLRHLGCVLRVEWGMTSRQTLTELCLSADAEVFTADASMNLPEQNVKPTGRARSVTLQLENITVEEGASLVAYMMLSPVDLSGSKLTLTLTSADGTQQTASVVGAALREGMTYPVAVNLSPPASPVFFDQVEEHQAATDATPLISALDAPSVTAPDFPVDTDNVLKADMTTGVALHPAAATATPPRTYNLAGQRCRPADSNRIYIRNGKKYIY